MSSYNSSANARAKRKMVLKQKNMSNKKGEQCSNITTNQSKRRMFTPLCDVTSHFVNEDIRINNALPVHDTDNDSN